VASSFLPLVGPLAPGQTTVPTLTMNPKTLQTNDQTAFPLTTIACNVKLTTQQAEDPELAAARQMLARAAEGIGQLEDHFIFNHEAGTKPKPKVKNPWTVRGQPNGGLRIAARSEEPVGRTKRGGVAREKLVRAIAAGIQGL